MTRRPDPNLLDWATHDITHLQRVMPIIWAEHRNTPAPDGLRSTAPTGTTRPIGTHSDPTPTAAGQKHDHNDPHAVLQRLTTNQVHLARLLKALCADATTLGHPCPQMPRCGQCGRSCGAMEGHLCPACARTNRRRNQRTLNNRRTTNTQTNTQ